MHARVPLDVDLEDRLVFGLTPIRLGYVVLSGLGSLATWTSQWSVAPVRGTAAVSIIAIGASAAWGRWKGRAADAWLTDLAAYLLNVHELRRSR